MIGGISVVIGWMLVLMYQPRSAWEWGMVSALAVMTLVVAADAVKFRGQER